jgi:DHA1 family multidrug resistance protein B-like MFS transporter
MTVASRETAEGLHPNVRLRLAVQFAATASSSMVGPFMAIYFVSLVGLATTAWMVIAVTVSAIVGGLVGGALSDRLGRRRWLVVAEAATSVCWSAVALFNSPWMMAPYLTFAAVFIANAFSGSLEPTVQAMILDVSPPPSRKRIYRISYWLRNLAVAIGVSLGGFLFLTHTFALIAAVALVNLASWATSLFWLKETHIGTPHASRPVGKAQARTSVLQIFGHYGAVAKDRSFLVFAAAAVLLNGLEAQIPNYIGIRLAHRMPPARLLEMAGHTVFVKGVAMVGVLQTENTILVVALVGLVGAWLRKLPDKWALFAGTVVYTAGFAVLGGALSPWALMLAMFVLTVGESTYIPVRQVYLAELVPDHARSSYMAAYLVASQGAALLGGIFIWIARAVPAWVIPPLYLAQGATGILCLLYVLRRFGGRREHSAPGPERAMTAD